MQEKFNALGTIEGIIDKIGIYGVPSDFESTDVIKVFTLIDQPEQYRVIADSPEIALLSKGDKVRFNPNKGGEFVKGLVKVPKQLGYYSL